MLPSFSAVVSSPTTRSLVRGALVCGALVLAACQPEVTNGTFPTQTPPDAGTDTSSGTQLGEGGGTGNMQGTWLLVHEQSNCVTFVGNVQEALSVSLEIVHFEQEGLRLREERETCAINLYPIFGLDNSFPNEVAQTINPLLVEDSFVSGSGFGTGYASGVVHQIYGFATEDPIADPMPSGPSDPRLVDHDEDGDPGVTLIVGGTCRMYVAQRALIRYLGTVVAPNQIRGRSITGIQQVVLGSSNLICRAERGITPNDPFSRFELSRIDGQGGAVNFDTNGDGRVTCDEVLPRQAELWTYRDPDPGNCGG